MAEHAVDGVEILPRLIVQLLGLGLELLKASLGIYEDWILRVLSQVELLLERLRSLLSWISAASFRAGLCSGLHTLRTLFWNPLKLISSANALL